MSDVDSGPEIDFKAMLPVIDKAFRENVPHNLALFVQVIEAARGAVVSRSRGRRTSWATPRPRRCTAG